ncbi:hypothetical protein FC40_GL000573 [Ligilactobacillus hayakitensis DSM 18933 = JCM 14209]|uniref:Uncharacterized protein n=1 Tax=Ligilactobacillus hayakitensis DSM 18933 = JCM 14209 TaxID=1423755 RepID=A0A0R1WRI5_9LACO|nr:hypothetical protein [Ligilactobacillus hayakitensis]KRM18788.1 hypothetical protein FC40_GL000573 [Ligilactobacillus hayakitensis DSM 18933 = JCM 14209]
MKVKVSQTDIKQFEAEAKRIVAQADKMRKQGEVIHKKVIKNVDILIAEKIPQLIGIPKDSKVFSIALNNSIFSLENVTSYTGLVADIYKAVSGVELSYGHESGYFDNSGNLERENFL